MNRATDGGTAQVQRFNHQGSGIEAFRTTPAFRRNGAAGEPPGCEAGPWAIEQFIEAPEDTRFLQSFKSFAASASFSDTAIFTKRYSFEDLLASFIDRARFHAGLKTLPNRVVVGRPVTFAGLNPNDALARQRYNAAFRQLGIDEIVYVLEPVAAAYFFAQRLQAWSTILVGDFGGGTSDFSIVRFEAPGAKVSAQALGHAGVGIAGESFDYRTIDAVVSPRLARTQPTIAGARSCRSRSTTSPVFRAGTNCA